MRMVIRIPKSFFQPTPLKWKIFSIFALLACFMLITALPIQLGGVEFFGIVSAVFMPLFIVLYAPVLMTQSWIMAMLSAQEITITITANIIQAVIIFVFILLYAYFLTCFLSPVIENIRKKSLKQRTFFLLLLGILVQLIYFSFFLPLLFFVELPIIVVLFSIYCFLFLRKTHALSLSLFVVLGLLLFGAYIIASETFQNAYCIRTPAPMQSEGGNTDVLVTEEEKIMQSTGKITPIGRCFQDFKLLPAVFDELSRSLLVPN